MSKKTNIINVVKLLIYKENSSILDKIDFEDEEIFLEPLLFAYFNSKKDNTFAPEILIEIMQGYFVKQEKPYLIEPFNKEGIAYIVPEKYIATNLISTI